MPVDVGYLNKTPVQRPEKDQLRISTASYTEALCVRCLANRLAKWREVIQSRGR
jgi:hypothetical protein